MIYRKSYRITQKVIWWRVSKSFRGALSSHDDVGENFGKATRPCPRFSNAQGLVETVIEAQREWPRRKFRDLIFHRSRHAIVLFVIPWPGWQMAKREVHEITRHPFSLSLSFSIFVRWKMFYDQTLGSPFKQHIANPTAESSNDRTWQNIVAKPSSCISCFSHHFCLWNWFIAIVAWKLGRAKCFPTFAAKPWTTKLL